MSLTTVLLSSLAALGSAGDDWPTWRGPDGQGVSSGKPPAQWSEKKNVRYKVLLPGKGSGTPIVIGDRIYLTTAVATGTAPPAAEEEQGDRGRRSRRGFGRSRRPLVDHQYVMMALDRADGSVVWKKVGRESKPHEGTHSDGTFASASVVSDGEILLAQFGSNGLFAYDFEGKELWKTDLGDMQVRGTFGEGASPAIHGDTVVVNWDHEGESFIVALDKKTGEEIWLQERDERSSWSTPLIVERDGLAQVIVNATGACAYDLESGDVLWTAGGNTSNVIPMPIHHDGMVFLASGFRGAHLQAIELDAADGDVTGTSAVAWTFEEDMPYVPSMVLHDGILYAVKGNSGMLSAFDAESGERLWGPERLGDVSNVYASPVVAGGHLYVVGRDGSTTVLKPGRKFEILHTNHLDEGCDASPAIAGDQLFLRGKKHLYCIEGK